MERISKISISFAFPVWRFTLHPDVTAQEEGCWEAAFEDAVQSRFWHRTFFGFLGRVCCHISMFVSFFRRKIFVLRATTAYMCAKNNVFELLQPLRGRVPSWLIDILISKPSFWLGGFLSGLSLFVEERRRRGELAMYVLPKALESAWKVARGRGYLPGSEATSRSGMGESLLTAIGMAMVMVGALRCWCTKSANLCLQSTYQIEPQHLSGLVRRILYQFVGPN